MIVTRELLKAEIDRIDERHLEELYRMVRILEAPTPDDQDDRWLEFIDATYGCMSDAPLVRPNLGEYEQREMFT